MLRTPRPAFARKGHAPSVHDTAASRREWGLGIAYQSTNSSGHEVVALEQAAKDFFTLLGELHNAIEQTVTNFCARVPGLVAPTKHTVARATDCCADVILRSRIAYGLPVRRNTW